MTIYEQPRITCPICGQEYIPAEIFIPEYFFGDPGEIIRDPAGKIEFNTGDNMGLEEEYVCDGCNTKLHIKTNISFEVTADPKEEDFEEEFKMPYNKPKKITLEEVSIF